MGSNSVDLITTLDGREYVTKEHLEKEIKQEVYKAGGNIIYQQLIFHDWCLIFIGRLSIMELQSTLNVDISNVDNSVKNIVQDESFSRVQGELISRYGTISKLHPIYHIITAS
jgi:hypothetical protein